MKPQVEALAYRIWAYAQPKGWDVTADEVAEALDVHRMRVLMVAYRKGWATRLRVARGRRNDMGAASSGAMGPGFVTDLSEVRDLTGALGYV